MHESGGFTPAVPLWYGAAVRARRRKGTLAWTSSTYFAEGLPWSLLHQVAAEYFTAIGLRPAQVGYTSLLHGPTFLKLLWSPIVELFGTLRGWMIGTQALLGVAVGVLAILAHWVVGEVSAAGMHPDPSGSALSATGWIWVVLVTIGVLSATHDIACDGYYMEALDADDQARFSGVRVAAFRAAMLVGSSGLVFLGGLFNWFVGFGVGAILLLGLALAHRRFLPRTTPPPESEPESKSNTESTTAPLASDTSASAPDAPGSANPASTPPERRSLRHVAAAYSSFLRQDRVAIVIAFLLTYKMADVLMFAMSKVLLDRELGIGTDLRGGFINTASTLASIAGAMLGGAWISRRGLRAALLPITLLMAVTEPLYALLAQFAPVLDISIDGVPVTLRTLDLSTHALTLSLATLTIVIEQVCGGMATAAQMVFIMRRCHPNHKAAHFAFATAIYSAAQMGVGAYSGRLYEQVGSVTYFWIVSAVTLPAVALSLLVPKDGPALRT